MTFRASLAAAANPPPSLNVQRWKATWSKQGAALEFVENRLGTTVMLDPVELRKLLCHLSATVLNIENNEGTLWGEEFRAMGENADRQLQWENYQPHLPCAQKIFNLIKNLPLTGFERSFRMAKKHLSRERFITGLPSGDIALADIQNIAAQLGIPPELKAGLDDGIAACAFVHFGYESFENSSQYKIYLEFPKGQNVARPLYIGYKWSTSEPKLMAVSNYRRVQLQDVRGLIGSLENYLGNGPAFDCVSALVGAASRRTPTSELLLVDVTDQSTPRHSFDLNLYSAGLRISEVIGTLRTLSRHFGIDESSMDPVIARASQDDLGHISGGTNRQGQSFLTFYHTCDPAPD